MSIVFHKSLILHRGHVTITRTLCRRVRRNMADMNIADLDSDVTCKFCLRLMKVKDIKENAVAERFCTQGDY